ncbi:MAG TPA: DUF1631 family protein [Cellvibrionaceae bacterium]
MTDLAKVVRLEVTNERMTKARLARLAKGLQACVEQARILLIPQLESCLDRLDDQLFSLADKAPNAQEQNTYFNSMRRVRQQRSAFLKRFTMRLQEAFASLDGTELTHATPLTADSLALMRPEDLDELIAVESMITQAHRNFGDVIAQLSFRMNSTVATPVYARNNPVGPESLCKIVSSAALQLDISAAIKLILLKAFNESVLLALEPVYSALIELLKKAPAAVDSGGSPADDVKDKRPAASNSTQIQTAQEHTNSVASTTTQKTLAGSADNFDEELASVLNELAKGGESVGQVISRELSNLALADLLTGLQQQKKPVENVLQPNDLILAISEFNGNSIELSRSQREVIHLVSLLFQFIFNAKNLAPEIIRLLVQVQIPAFRVALVDDEFFTHKGHPLRRLLNAMALASVGYSPSVSDPLYRKIDAVVQVIHQQFVGDQTIFTQLFTEFSAFIAQEERRAALCERRVTDAEDGKALAEKARKRVSVEVGLRTDGFILTEPLREFISTVWFQVLFVRCLRAGNDSVPWREGLQTLTDLVWSVQPLKTAKDRQALIIMVPHLMERLRLGLEDIAFDPFATADFCSLINRLHRDSVAGFIPAKKSEATPSASDSSNKSPASASVESQTAASGGTGPDDLHWQQVATFAPGSWFDIIEPGQPVLRCRLAAVIKQTGTFIFVNRSGVKVAERQHHQLALGLRSGQLRPLDSSLLFDRALEEVVAGLRKTTKSPLDIPEVKRDKKD